MDEETVYAAEGTIILIPCSVIGEHRVLGGARTGASNETGGERGGSGSENHEVKPSGQRDSTSAHCNVLLEGVHTRVPPEGDDEIDLAKK